MVAILIMYADKQKARKNKWRIPEKRIWLVALFGGATGAVIGMYSFRHKTKHRMFVILLPVISILQWILIYEIAVSNGDVINRLDNFIR